MPIVPRCLDMGQNSLVRKVAMATEVHFLRDDILYIKEVV